MRSIRSGQLLAYQKLVLWPKLLKFKGIPYQALHALFPTAQEFSVGPKSKKAPDILSELCFVSTQVLKKGNILGGVFEGL